MITNRHCSYLFNKDQTAVICHSARARSTFRLSRDATSTVFPRNGNPYQRPFKNCRLAFASFQKVIPLGQAAIDSFIEAIEIDSSLNTAERLAVSAAFPEWSFATIPWGKGEEKQAIRQDGGFQEIHSTTGTWFDLAEKLN